MNKSIAPGKNDITKWVESIIVTILLPVIGYMIDSLDPFFVNYHFPWLILAPLLIALRHGLAYGIVAATVLVGIVTTGFLFDWQEVPFFPKEMIVGLLLVTIISAEFHETWIRKIKFFESKYHHINARMDKFTREYHLLKGSHRQLELHVASQAKSLRSFLHDLERHILSLEKNEGEPLKGISASILKLFSDFASVQIAAIYAITDDERKEINPEPVAYLGHTPPLLISDPLVREALKTGLVASIKLENENAMDTPGTLVVIPLIDVYQKIWGLVVVNEMPLFALQESTMDLFAVLGGSIGDLVKRRAEAYSYIDDRGKDVELKLRRVLNEIKLLKTSAMLIGAIIDSEELKNKYLTRFQANLRGVDKIWIFNDEQNYKTYLILLPYTDENGANEFLNRIGLSELLAKKVCYESNTKVLSYHDSEVSLNMWSLNNKTSLKKLVSEIYQFYKNRTAYFNIQR
ncbi:hypothetical protein [Nitrosomonas communis]|uniref:PelD GGDEF domain-containing protein n=1 Tax=Nitrosomonas communis TaxID=44574 RepID=A0A1I4PCX1_9PROT|nr:hypothetical protein [Nitrosomonas communis]SFM25465.1 PelD GGDEF domain-containing protein [Nitrosomonas communis]